MSRPTPSFEAPSFQTMVHLACLVLAMLWLASPVTGVAAGPLDDARAGGTVAERYDGYAMVREESASAEIRQLVKDINAKRKALYQKRAASEGAPLDQVGKIYAREVFRSAPSGTWFLQENGSWVQK